MREKEGYPERIIPGETSGGPLISHLKRYEFARQYCGGKVVLDAACGVGYGTHYLAGTAREVIGVDISAEALEHARNNYSTENVRFEQMDVADMRFADNSFDVVCSFETIEHLDDPEALVAQACRMLKKDGLFIVSTPHVNETTHSPANPFHKVEYSRRDFEALLRRHFGTVEIFGERRLQSAMHYYLQRLDLLNLRRVVPSVFRKKVNRALKTTSWEDVGFDDIVISREGIGRATELVALCRLPRVQS